MTIWQQFVNDAYLYFGIATVILAAVLGIVYMELLEWKRRAKESGYCVVSRLSNELRQLKTEHADEMSRFKQANQELLQENKALNSLCVKLSEDVQNFFDKSGIEKAIQERQQPSESHNQVTNTQYQDILKHGLVSSN